MFCQVLKNLKKYLTGLVVFSLILVLGSLSLETKAGLLFQETRQWQIAADEIVDYYAPDGNVGGTWAQTANADQSPDDIPDTDELDNQKELYTYGYSNVPTEGTINNVYFMLRWKLTNTDKDDDLELKYKIGAAGTWKNLNGTDYSSDTGTEATKVTSYTTQSYAITASLSWTDLGQIYLAVQGDKDAGPDNYNADIDCIWLRIDYTPGNQAPAFAADPNDPREDPDSTCDSPTNVDSTITFRATATDGESDSWKLLVCKANEAPTPSATDPVCGASGQWCRDGSFRASEVESTCQYTVLVGDYETKDWYAFACDNNSADPKCSTANQGGVDSVSPFTVNRIPSFTLFQDDSPVDPNATVTWSTTASDSDTGGTCANDTISLYVCKANDFTGTACGAGGTWCSSLNDPDGDPICNTAAPRPDGDWAAYGFVRDNHNFEASPQGGNSVLSVNNVAPSITNTTIQLLDTDEVGDLTLTTAQGETTGFKVKFTVVDDNSCENLAAGNEIASAIIHVRMSEITQAACDTDAEDDDNNCYANAHTGTGGSCTQDTSTCTGTTDTDAAWTCLFPLQYYADSTVTGTPKAAFIWLAAVKATDDDGADTGLVDDADGTEMGRFMAYSITEASIAYGGPLAPGATSAQQATTFKATGNVGLDNKLSGTNMTSGANTILVGEQEHSFTDSFSYGTGTGLTTTPTEYELDCSKTTTATPAGKATYWLIQIPTGQETGDYSGTNTLEGKSDNENYGGTQFFPNCYFP